MKAFFKNRTKLFSLCLAFLLSPFTANTVPSGEIIYVPSTKLLEMWISSVDGRDARQLFKLPLFTLELSIQEGDRYIVVVAEGMENEEIEEAESGIDAYLLDTQDPLTRRKDLTLGRFSEISDVAISRNGDVVFSNTINQVHPDGIYLIPKYEIHNPIPAAEKLFNGPAGYVDWAPNGEDIAFSNLTGIFLLNIFTRQTSLIVEEGFRPVFSPDGKYLAFFTRRSLQNQLEGDYGIGIVALHAPADVKRLEIKKGSFPRYITWSADGRYIAYALYNSRDQFSYFAVPRNGGKHKPIFQAFDGGLSVFEWMRKEYSPVNLLTTTWGGLKARGVTGVEYE